MKNSIVKLVVCIAVVVLPMAGYTQNAIKKSTIKHVVVIGFDGWGAYSVPKANMPNVKIAMEKGAYTLHARSVLPSSSAVNWASMLMGASPELHGFTEWGSKMPELPSRVVTERYGMFPSIVGLLRDQLPNAEIGYFYEWDGMAYLIEKEAANAVVHITADSLNATSGTDNVVDYIRTKKPTFTMVVYDEPDGVGHKIGHDTPAYYEMLTKLDQNIARIQDAVRDAGILENTLFLLVADHGGINKGHGGKTMAEMEIPIILYGAGVKQGYEITESIMIYDIATTIAYVFNLRVPQVWIGRPITAAFKN